MDLEKKRKTYTTMRPSPCLFNIWFCCLHNVLGQVGKDFTHELEISLSLCMRGRNGMFLTWCRICWILEAEWEAEVPSGRQEGRKGSQVGSSWRAALDGKSYKWMWPVGEITPFLLPSLPIVCSFLHCGWRVWHPLIAAASQEQPWWGLLQDQQVQCDLVSIMYFVAS